MFRVVCIALILAILVSGFAALFCLNIVDSGYVGVVYTAEQLKMRLSTKDGTG